MNFSIAKNLGLVLVLIGLLSACQSNQHPETTSAPPTPSPTAAATPSEVPAAVPTTEADAATTPIPDTLGDLWQAIDAKNAELEATIKNGPLDNVHHQAFALRDLVAALPGKSPSLSVDEKTKLENEVKFVATLAARLDAAGDAGDRADAQANYDKLVGVLNGIARSK